MGCHTTDLGNDLEHLVHAAGLFAHSLQPLPERLLEDLPPKDRQMRHRNRIVRRLPGQRLTKLLELDLHVFDPSVERG